MRGTRHGPCAYAPMRTFAPTPVARGSPKRPAFRVAPGPAALAMGRSYGARPRAPWGANARPAPARHVAPGLVVMVRGFEIASDRPRCTQIRCHSWLSSPWEARMEARATLGPREGRVKSKRSATPVGRPPKQSQRGSSGASYPYSIDKCIYTAFQPCLSKGQQGSTRGEARGRPRARKGNGLVQRLLRARPVRRGWLRGIDRRRGHAADERWPLEGRPEILVARV